MKIRHCPRAFGCGPIHIVHGDTRFTGRMVRRCYCDTTVALSEFDEKVYLSSHQ